MKDLGEAFLCLVLRFTEIGPVVYWVYHRRHTLIVCLKDLIWMAIHPMMLLLLNEISFLNPKVHRMILKEKQ